MFWKLLEKIGNLKLAVWLLTGAAFSFLLGASVAQDHFSLFRSLNSTRIQDWFLYLDADKLYLTVWMWFLFLFLFLLGINTVACLAVRLKSLLPRYGKIPFRRFALLLSPSLIHLLFAGVLLGHGVTFTMGEWKNIPVAAGSSFELPDGSAQLKVQNIRYSYYPDNSLFRGRIKNIFVSLAGDNGAGLQLAMPGYVSFKGYRLMLMMKKKRKTDPVDQVCNKAPLYQKKSQQKRAKLYIRMVKDPGLPLITICFVLILLLLGWYYFGARQEDNGQ